MIGVELEKRINALFLLLRLFSRPLISRGLLFCRQRTGGDKITKRPPSEKIVTLHFKPGNKVPQIVFKKKQPYIIDFSCIQVDHFIHGS